MKILVLAHEAYSIVNFRGDMIKAMVSRGHSVVAAAPEKGYDKHLKNIGAEYKSVPFNRTSTNPLHDLNLIKKYSSILQAEAPDVVFAYAIKPVIYSSIAAKLIGFDNNMYAMIPGAGYVFYGKGLKSSIIRMISTLLYRIACAKYSKVFFQNTDDINEFVKRNLISEDKCIKINGSGVSVDKFKPQPLPKENVFLFIGRLIRDKGLIEYMKAARKVKKDYPSARFLIVGPFDTNPTAIKEDDIAPYIEDGSVEYLGKTSDVRPFLKRCSAFVLPSYHEGTPRSVLEAMATARPIITTDAPGCRETVEDGVNGFLVPVKDVEQLAEKMIWMIEHKEKARKMGQKSRRICEEKYDVNKVNKVILDTMNL